MSKIDSFYSPTIKHHKYLAVASFDWHALKLVHGIGKLFARRRSDEGFSQIAIRDPKLDSEILRRDLSSVDRAPQWHHCVTGIPIYSDLI
jgi:hypothetical protein